MAAPPTSTGFVNLSQYLNANKDDVGQMAGNLVGRDQAAANNAMAEANNVGQETYQGARGHGASFDPTSLPDYAKAQGDLSTASQNIQGLGTGPQNNVQTQLQGAYGKTGTYGQGDSGFDAALVNGSGKLAGAAGGYQGLSNYLNNQVATNQAAGLVPQPVAPAPAPSKPLPGPNPVQQTPTAGDTGTTGVYVNYQKPGAYNQAVNNAKNKGFF